VDGGEPEDGVSLAYRDGERWVRAFVSIAASAAGADLGAAHARPNLRHPYVPPSTDTERAVAELWQLLLRVDRIGVHDSFLDLGGDSLLATQLVTRVRERFGVKVSLPELFELPTPAALAARIDALSLAQRDDADLAGLLARLESLSAEEVEAMLAERGLDAAGQEGTAAPVDS
jgi:acyl carrier protein